MAISVTGPSVPAIEVQLQNVVLSGSSVQPDWSQNDAQAADFVKNRPGAYMTGPVVTEIYNGTLPEQAQIQMDYVPNIGDIVTVKVGTESIDCTIGDYDGLAYFATVPIEDIVGGTATNYVLCYYYGSQWVAQSAGTYTGQNAVFEAAIRQVVKIPEKFLELENVKDVYWIKFEYDKDSKMYFSYNLDGTYAEYEDIKAAIVNGKLVAAIGEVFGESVNVGFVTEYWKYVDGLTASFYETSDPDTYDVLMRLAYFVCRSGHIWKKVNSSIELASGKPMPSTLEGEQGNSNRVARSDHSHPDRTSIQFLGKLIDGDEKTVACGNVSPDTPFVASGLDIPISAEITLGFDDFTPDTPITMTWGGTADAYFNNMGKSWKVSLAYNACTDAYTVTTTRALTNLTLTYKAVPAQTKDYQKCVLAPYTVAPHLLLASPNGLHKLTVDDNGNVLVDGVSVDGTVTEANIEKALGYKPIGADDVPVKSVNGATGATKSTFYVTVTPTGSGYAATADKTAAEVYAAYVAGYAVYAVVKFASVAAPFELPLVAAVSVDEAFMLGFGALGSINPTDKPQYPTVAYTGVEWRAWLGTLARSSDIPTIPTELKNPWPLNIKIGNATTTYDGSAAKTVEIPEGGPTDAQVSSAVDTWLTEHPEATTTVQDGSVTDAKLSDNLYKQITGDNRHKLTEVSVPLIEYVYGSWTAGSGTNNGIAPILTPKKFRFANPSTSADVSITVQFMDGDDPAAATLIDPGAVREQFKWVVPAGETVEFDTEEYGRTATKYIRLRWTNWPRVLLAVTAIYDSYQYDAPQMDNSGEYIKDLPPKWTLNRKVDQSTEYRGWCAVPFYPDTDYYIFNAYAGMGSITYPAVIGLPNETFFHRRVAGWAMNDGGVSENQGYGKWPNVYKSVIASQETLVSGSYKWLKLTTKPWSETIGAKYLAIEMGGYEGEIKKPYVSGEEITDDQVKAFFDAINAAGSPAAYISRFSTKIDRPIYSEIVMANPLSPDTAGTYGIAIAEKLPSPLAKAKWTLFGDSLTDEYGGHDWTGKYFASKIAREFAITLDNRAKSGSNIYRGGSGNYTSVSGMIKLDELISEIEAGTTEQPDYITIAFGTNSFTAQIGTDADTSETDTTVYGATKRFIEVLREKCPKSVFGFVLSPKQDWGTADPNNTRAVDAARVAIKAVCEDYGVPYIDMSTQSGITVAMLPDGIHISNDQSQNLYYHAMRRFMMGL